MKVSELMKSVTLKPDYKGGLAHNNMVLAINTDKTGKVTSEKDYAVLQIQIESTEASLDSETSEKTYIRSGKSTSKTGTSRSFAISGERYIGDEAQDFIFSHDIKFGKGSDVEVDYVYFNMITGKGEKGKMMIVVNNDGGGDASGGLEIDVELNQCGQEPVEFDYSTVTA